MLVKFHLESGDVLVNIITGNSLYNKIKRACLGSPYSHVFLYMGELGLFSTRAQRRIIRVPMIFESNGRGVTLRSLSSRYGEKVVVMRLKAEHDRRRIPRVLLEAIELASSFQSYYDYLVIVTFLIPWLICQRLHIPIPLKYQRNALMICSEACAEIFWRAGVEIVPRDIIPLPSSFVETDLLTKVREGVLGVDLL